MAKSVLSPSEDPGAIIREFALAKPKARKLKVFQAEFGFYDSVVAAPSQAAALRAWGTHQNLFASGEAIATTDKAAVAAATAQPETPLRRALGSSDPFVIEPTALPTPRRAKGGGVQGEG